MRRLRNIAFVLLCLAWIATSVRPTLANCHDPFYSGCDASAAAAESDCNDVGHGDGLCGDCGSDSMQTGYFGCTNAVQIGNCWVSSGDEVCAPPI